MCGGNGGAYLYGNVCIHIAWLNNGRWMSIFLDLKNK